MASKERVLITLPGGVLNEAGLVPILVNKLWVWCTVG